MAKLTSLEQNSGKNLIHSHSITSGKLSTSQFQVLPYITGCLSSSLHLTPQPNSSCDPIHYSKFKAHGNLPRTSLISIHLAPTHRAPGSWNGPPKAPCAALGTSPMQGRAGGSGSCRARCRCTERTPPRKGIPPSLTAGTRALCEP